MSDELSRVKSRKKQYKGEVRPAVKAKKNEQATADAARQPDMSAGRLTRSGRQKMQAAAAKEPWAADEAVLAGETTPSRTSTYPSERLRLSKMFVNSLIVIFVVLLVGLLWWGIEGAPELRTLLW